MDKEILNQFLNTKVKLVKNDDFVIWGIVTNVFNNAIAFYTDGRTIYLTFDVIFCEDCISDLILEREL